MELYIVERLRRAGESTRELFWDQPENGERPFGRIIGLSFRTSTRGNPMSIGVVSPRLLLELARAPQDILLINEFGLVALYAVLSKIFRRRKVISMIENDYRHMGLAHNIFFKVALRKLAQRFVDVFVANCDQAKNYMVETLGTPAERVIVGWWLAGLPEDLTAYVPSAARDRPKDIPVFLSTGQLIARKGIDLLIEAVATYRRKYGPCTLWIVGDGPERGALTDLVRRLDLEESVVFFGILNHASLKGLLERCDVFVFPTLQDLIGRVVVEALTEGAPVVLSPMSGAAGTIVHDGTNGIIVDPRSPERLAEALHRAADPQSLRHLREGVRRTNAALTPHAAAEVLLRAVAVARGSAR
jgi:glycosyltransferase involved in cell wall biosynthesis